MTYRITSILTISLLTLLAGCGPSAEVQHLQAERDSLQAVNAAQADQLDHFGETIETLNATLDSIAEQERMLFRGQDGLPVTREDVRFNLSRFENLLKKQTQKINALEAKLAASADSSRHALQLIAHLKEQIEAKNREIAALQTEVAQKNFDIAQLTRTVQTQTEEISSQAKTIRRQNDALSYQDSLLNHGYYLIGSKDDLRRKGIINKKGTLNADAVLDRTKFAPVNVRTWRSLNITAKRPRILSNMPQSSYRLTTNGKHEFTLEILDATSFWSVSNYLIIQTE
jgi:hypothetical protein